MNKLFVEFKFEGVKFAYFKQFDVTGQINKTDFVRS